MQDIPIKQIIQREKWRIAKARWRAKVKDSPPVEKPPGERRHPRAKLTLDEEAEVFRDFLTGSSYRVLCARYSLAVKTVTKILSYWKGLCEERFHSFSQSDIPTEEPQLLQEESGGFF